MRAVTKKIRYFCEAILVKMILSFFSILPYEQASSLGGKIARIIGRKLAINRRAYKNLNKVMPHITHKEKTNIIADMWENLGRIAGELPHINTLPIEKFSAQLTIEGQEHINDIIDRKQTCIFLAAHIGNWEVLPRVAESLRIPFSLIYRQANNKLVDKMITDLRKNDTIPVAKGRKSMRMITASLREGKSIGMLVDQKTNEGLEVPFFGIPAMTTSTPARLALQFNCPIVLVQVTRVEKTHFKISVSPPVYLQHSGKKKEDIYQFTLYFNQMIEKWIKENPGQWLWLHNRWPKQK